jgi:hypothetical protein
VEPFKKPAKKLSKIRRPALAEEAGGIQNKGQSDTTGIRAATIGRAFPIQPRAANLEVP